MPRSPLPADPIGDLVDRLEGSLVAGRRSRRELAREIEGDLREDLAARVAAGAPRAEAAAAVAAEFGEPGAIAAELSAELLADRGRRYAPIAAVGAAMLLAAWYLAMTTLAGIPGFRVPVEDGWMLQVSRALDVAGPLVVGVALAGWAAARRSGSLAAIATVAALQLAFALSLVAGAIAMAAAVTVPAAGMAVLVALVVLTLLVGTGLAAASAVVLLRWGAVRRGPRPARS